MTRHDPPDVIPEGAKAVVDAEYDLTGTVTYDIWSVAHGSWTQRLTKAAALDRLMAEGYRKSRARQLLARARVRADNQARAIGRFG